MLSGMAVAYRKYSFDYIYYEGIAKKNKKKAFGLVLFIYLGYGEKNSSRFFLIYTIELQ